MQAVTSFSGPHLLLVRGLQILCTVEERCESFQEQEAFGGRGQTLHRWTPRRVINFILKIVQQEVIPQSFLVSTLNLKLGLNFLANHCGICDSVSHFQFATQSYFKMRLEMKLIWCSVSF